MSEHSDTEQDSNSIRNLEGKYLTFFLSKEEYGIAILKIKEIIGMMPVTKMPQVPGFVKGVINLRGQIIPIIDLRLRFDMDSIDYTDRTCIIVVEISDGRGNLFVTGIVVDAVSEVMIIKKEDIESPPTFGATVDTDLLLGMAKIEKDVKLLLDIDKVLKQDEINQLEAA